MNSISPGAGPTPEELRRVQEDNLEATRFFDPETTEDLGYQTTDEVLELMHRPRETQAALEHPVPPVADEPIEYGHNGTLFDMPRATKPAKPNAAPASTSRARRSRRLYEVPSQSRRNPYDNPPSCAEMRRGMTPEEIERQRALNRAGAAAARAVLASLPSVKK